MAVCGINPQIQALKRADIVVGCPGRLLDHLGRGTVDLSRLEVLVLDEADQMFDMGFFPDIRRIISHVPQKKSPDPAFLGHHAQSDPWPGQ
jgi:ATP-dependent RNA helicase RhlE